MLTLIFLFVISAETTGIKYVMAIEIKIRPVNESMAVRYPKSFLRSMSPSPKVDKV
jgi:hypothetical protein